MSLGGNITAAVLNIEYEIVSIVNEDSYTISAAVNASAGDTGNGGASTVGAYQLNTGSATGVPFTGWGGGTWGQGTWGNGGITTSPIRLWSQSNFGEDLFFVYRGGPLCYWAASTGVSTRGNIINLTNYPASDGVPTIANIASVSDIFRFAFCFGTNVIDSAVLDPMLIRESEKMRRDYTPVILEFWYSIESHYDDESEDINDELRIKYEGETVDDVLQQAAENWDYDDESVINFDAESDLIETTCDVVYIFEMRGEEKIDVTEELVMKYQERYDEQFAKEMF